MKSLRLAIRGVGAVGGFGCIRSKASDGIAFGHMPNGHIKVQLADKECRCPVFAADDSLIRAYMNPAKLRRMNRSSRLALLATCLACEDASLSLPTHSPGTAIVMASGYGAATTTFDFLDNVIQEGDMFASPTLFSNSVQNSAASNISIAFGITGPCLTVTQFEMSPVSALLNARYWLLNEIADTVLFVAMDEINDLLGYSYVNYFGPEMPTCINPMEFETQTAIPGEGAVCFVLTRDNGHQPACGFIESVSWSNVASFSIPEKTRIVAGADGHRACGLDYKKLFKSHAGKIITYSDRYGSVPCGQAFDLALSIIEPKKENDGSLLSLKVDAYSNVGAIGYSV